jgi:hypothetical protein
MFLPPAEEIEGTLPDDICVLFGLIFVSYFP